MLMRAQSTILFRIELCLLKLVFECTFSNNSIKLCVYMYLYLINLFVYVRFVCFCLIVVTNYDRWLNNMYLLYDH